MTLRASRCRGFTLIEALVALVILAAGATVILEYEGRLLDREARRAQTAEMATRTLNALGEPRHIAGAADSSRAIFRDGARLIPDDMGEARFADRNFNPWEATLPPMDQARTPWFARSVLDPTQRGPVVLMPARTNTGNAPRTDPAQLPADAVRNDSAAGRKEP